MEALTPEKRRQILEWFREGKLRRLNDKSYSVPSEAFVLGITPRMVHQVLGPVEETEE